MTRDEILAEIQTILRETLDNDAITIDFDTVASDIEGWDSLAHMNIVALVEKRFSIRFGLGELTQLLNINDFINTIIEKQI